MNYWHKEPLANVHSGDIHRLDYRSIARDDGKRVLNEQAGTAGFAGMLRRRNVIRGSILMGVASLGAACSSRSDSADSKSSSIAPTSGQGEVPVAPNTSLERNFVSASAFSFNTSASLKVISGWPALEYPKSEMTATATLSLPPGASKVAVDILWTTESIAPGSARWAGGIKWLEQNVALDDPRSGGDWQFIVAERPDLPREPATSRLGEYLVNNSSPCVNLTLARQADATEDTFPDAALMLGVAITVTATVP